MCLQFFAVGDEEAQLREMYRRNSAENNTPKYVTSSQSDKSCYTTSLQSESACGHFKGHDIYDVRWGQPFRSSMFHTKGLSSKTEGKGKVKVRYLI